MYARCVRIALAVVALTCGCNQVFDIRGTAPLDAAYFDAPVDAPFTCTPIGTPPPSFARTVQQYIVQECREMTLAEASGWRAATCTEPTFGPALAAPGDAVFTPLAMCAPVGFVAFDQTRIAPEGDELFVRRYNSSIGSSVRIERYRRVAETWSGPDLIVDPADVDIVIGQPTGGPERRMMAYAGGTYSELEIPASGMATTVAQYGPADLGITNADQYPANLSADGLRMVFTARLPGVMSQQVLYTDRASRAERFRHAVPLEGVPVVSDTVLTATCDRVYFSALQSIFYEQQH